MSKLTQDRNDANKINFLLVIASIFIFILSIYVFNEVLPIWNDATKIISDKEFYTVRYAFGIIGSISLLFISLTVGYISFKSYNKYAYSILFIFFAMWITSTIFTSLIWSELYESSVYSVSVVYIFQIILRSVMTVFLVVYSVLIVTKKEFNIISFQKIFLIITLSILLVFFITSIKSISSGSAQYMWQALSWSDYSKNKDALSYIKLTLILVSIIIVIFSIFKKGLTIDYSKKILIIIQIILLVSLIWLNKNIPADSMIDPSLVTWNPLPYKITFTTLLSLLLVCEMHSLWHIFIENNQ